jgi:hypothetical protein
MAAPIEVELVARTAAFTAGIKQAQDTVRNGSAAMQRALDLLGGSFDAAGKASGDAAGAMAKSKSANDNLRESIRQVAAAEILATNARKEAKAALTAGSIDLLEYRARLQEVRVALQSVRSENAASARAMQQVHGSTGQAKFGLQDLGFQLSDVATQFAGGTRAAVIFAQQGPQIVQAVQMMSGGTSKFAQFMSSAWGAGIMVGVAVLGALVAKMTEAGDESKKTGDAFETLADKLNLTRHSYEDVLKAARDYNAEQRKTRQLTLDAAAATAAQAAANIGAALAIRQKLAAELAAAEMALKGPGPEGGRTANYGGNYAAQVEQEASVAGLRQRIADNNKELQDLTATARNAVGDVATEIAKLRTDPQYAIEERFKRLRNEARASIKDVSALTARLADLNRQEAAAKKNLEAATRSGSGTGAAEQASIGDMTALIKTMFPGARITSTTGGKHVAGSDHYAGRAIDFVPAGGMGQYSKAQVEQMLKDAGVNIRRNAQGVEQFFGPGDKGHSDHFHVAWTGSASPEEMQRRMQAAAEKQQRAIEQAAAQAKEYADTSAGLNSELLQAQRANITDASQLADLARQQVVVERDKLIADIEAKAVKNPVIAAHKQELEDVVRQVAAQKLLTINTQEQARLADEALKNMRAANDNQRDILQSALSLARTATERRDIQLRLLDKDREEERRQLQNTAANAALSPDERARAQDRLSQIDTIYAGRAAVVKDQTAGPLETYAKGLRLSPEQINERVQQYTVDELNAVHDGITSAITNAIGVNDPFISNMISLLVDQLLIRPITEALMKAQSAGGGGIGGLLGSIGGLFGGGGGGGFDSIGAGGGGLDAVMNTLPAFANGTSGAPGGWSLVGEHGPELLNLPTGAQVTPTPRTGALLKQMQFAPRNDNGWRGDAHFHFPNVTNAREARESGEQAARAFRRRVNGPVRSNG